MRRIDLKGNIFGRLTALAEVPERDRSKIRWLCRCVCGEEVSVISGDLRSGRTQSCGCLRKETARNICRKHDGADTPEYVVWAGMKQRCTNPNHISFRHYGAR